MIRSIISHEVLNHFTTLSFRVAEIESIKITKADVRRRTRKLLESLKVKAAILQEAVDRMVEEIKKSKHEVDVIFREHKTMYKVRDLKTLTLELKRQSSSDEEIPNEIDDHAGWIHRLVLNQERMLQLAFELFDDSEKPEAVINLDTILKDIRAVLTINENRRLIDDGLGIAIHNGYRSSLISALTNLVRNALNYSKASVKINASQKNLQQVTADYPNFIEIIDRDISEHQFWYVMSVKDRGQGIPEKHISTLFKPFFRMIDGGPIQNVDPGRKMNQGIGLTLVKRAAEKHSGVAIARNRVPNGMDFAIIIPKIELNLKLKRHVDISHR